MSGYGTHDFGHGEAWNHGGWDHHGGWAHDQAWWHDHGRYWPGWWGGGFWWPGFDFGWWPGYYGYYGGYWDIAPYYYRNAYVDYGYAPAPYTAAYPPDVANTATPEAADTAGMGFYSHAVEAFQQGDYRNAARLAGHASIDDPRNADVHAMLMLGLFAIGEYRGAAIEAQCRGLLGQAAGLAETL